MPPGRADHVDPATGEVIANVASVSEQQVVQAIEAADRALVGWSALNPKVG
jgi:succinate-semialdehyde dehydrogenase/glutarate-semialdehyde dehydrogenase